MRSPEYNSRMRRPPDAKQFENEYYQYLAPESFTVLPPDEQHVAVSVPSPPKAPEPYKLTPRRRQKNKSFAIIAEPNLNIPDSLPGSRAGSPTGRVSPFRGRGFNPTGSRHASPVPSPPPGHHHHHAMDKNLSSTDDLNELQLHHQSAVTKLSSNSTGRLSQIPVLKSALRNRRSSTEDILTPESSPTAGSSGGGKRQRDYRSNLQESIRYSQSMSNIGPKHLISKPPPSPRRSNLKQSFVRLSPIIGSSPEGGSDQIQSSPSRIPRSRSQPPSRLVSPNNSRGVSRVTSRNPSRATSRPVSRNVSRNGSRESSPAGINSSPTKNNNSKNSAYRNIPAKIDSFNNRLANNKPKVPQKPKVYSTRSTSMRKISNASKVGSKSGGSRKEITTTTVTEDTETTDTEREITRNNTRASIYSNGGQSRANGRANNRFTDNEKPSTSKSSNSSNGGNSKAQISRTESRKSLMENNSQTYRRDDKTGAKHTRNKRFETTTETDELSKTEDDEMTEDAKDDDILSVTIDGIISNSTQQIVATTTETVVKPLNIEAKLIKQSEAINESVASSNKTTTKTATSSSVVDNKTGSNPTTIINNNSNPTNNNSNVVVAPTNGSVINNSASPPNNLNNSSEQSVTQQSNNVKQLTGSVVPSTINTIEMNVKNNFNNLTPPDSDKVNNKNLMDPTRLTNSPNERLRQQRTVIVDEIKPIKITVREKSGDVEVQSGNIALPRSATNGIAERPSLPPNNNHPPNSAEPPPNEAPKQGAMSKLFSCFKKKPKDPPSSRESILSGSQNMRDSTLSGSQNLGVLETTESLSAVEEEGKAPGFWSRMCGGKKTGKVGDSKISLPKLSRTSDSENWAERRDSILSNETPKNVTMSQRLRKLFCACKRNSPSRRQSMISKKKSLSSQMQPPPEDTGPKLDASLVEHASHMRGAIPVLPVPLAWTCLIFNVFVPGFGTILSGLICLCIGKARFSQRDSAKSRFGAFLINIIVGISQAFTVLFCLVGWGWSIWWGVIMIKVGRKYRKLRAAEKKALAAEQAAAPTIPSVNVNQDVEKGTT